MTDVGTTIKSIYPDAVVGEDYLFTDDIHPDGRLDIKKWNESKLGPRPASMEELQAWADSQALEVAKLFKKSEIAAKAVEEMADVYTKGVDGKEELLFELTKAVYSIGQALGIPSITDNVRLSEVVRCGNKGRAKQTEIENAVSVEAVEDIQWEPG